MRCSGILITNGQCIHSMRRSVLQSSYVKRQRAPETGDPAYARIDGAGAGSNNNSATTTYTRKRQGLHQRTENLYYRCERVPIYAGVGARSATERSEKAFTLWWVDSSKPGIKINPLHKIGWHMLSTCEVYLDNVEVEGDMVGEEGMGFLNVMYNFEMERLINAAQHRLCRMRIRRCRPLCQPAYRFGKPIGHNQMIQKTGADGEFQDRQHAQHGVESGMASRSASVTGAHQRGAGKTVLRTYRNGSH